MRPSRPAPTLDEIAARPELARRLAPADRAAVLARIAGALAALASADVAAAAPDQPAREDRLLGVGELARRLDVSAGHVYRNASAWPFTVRRGRKLGFSERGAGEWIADQQRAAAE